MLRDLYAEFLRVAASSQGSRARLRAASEGGVQVGDLAHDVLLKSIARGAADLSTLDTRAWLLAALRKHAAFEARTESRRRAREARWQTASEAHAGAAPRPWRFTPELLDKLSPGLRVLAALASAELEPREIRSVLRLSDTAFRKRLSDLARAVRDARAAGIEVVGRRPAAYALGPARAQLLASLKGRSTWAVASHDPDGHPLIFSRIGAHRLAGDGNSQQEEQTS